MPFGIGVVIGGACIDVVVVDFAKMCQLK